MSRNHNSGISSGTFCDNGNEPTCDFFKRNGLGHPTRDACESFARSHFPGTSMKPASHQGYCSYTIDLSGTHLLQFRPKTFVLDVRICNQARAIFPGLIPSTLRIGTVTGTRISGRDGEEDTLDAYLQETIPGVTLKEFRSTEASHPSDTQLHRERLVKDLAVMFATSYLHQRRPGNVPPSFNRGRIGDSLRERLAILRRLQDQSIVRQVDDILRRISVIESDTPWCLTHGDLVPSNIMVDPATGHLTGLIDWAEGEWLPFGIGLYGIEEVLGEEEADGSGFRYYADHEELRRIFWVTFLQTARPCEAVRSGRWFADLELCRKFGILLWRGIAFDNGKLDRVVEPEKDALEVQKLALFLGAPCAPGGSIWMWRARLLLWRLASIVRGPGKSPSFGTVKKS